jgi:hypothetical protein
MKKFVLGVAVAAAALSLAACGKSDDASDAATPESVEQPDDLMPAAPPSAEPAADALADPAADASAGAAEQVKSMNDAAAAAADTAKKVEAAKAAAAAAAAAAEQKADTVTQ